MIILTILYAPIDPTNAVQGSYTGLIVYVVLALGVSFVCSVLEAVLLSSSQSYIEQLVQQGRRAGVLMKKHKEDVERPISAILTLNTIAHTVGAAGAGAQAAGLFGNQYLGIISAILTLAILVLSEIIPKTLGAVYWKQLTPVSAYVTQFLVVVLAPAVWVFEKLTRVIRRDSTEFTVTRADIEVLAKISAQEGALLEREKHVLANLLYLNQVKVEDIMTPRTVMTALQQDLTVKQVVEHHPLIHFSRIPIYDKSVDDVTGYVLRYKILQQSAIGADTSTLKELGDEIYAVPESASVADILNQLITMREHLFLVTDEYGGTAGIVTLEDSIETLLGLEIVDESDPVEDLRKLAQSRSRKKREQLFKAGQSVEI